MTSLTARTKAREAREGHVDNQTALRLSRVPRLSDRRIAVGSIPKRVFGRGKRVMGQRPVEQVFAIRYMKPGPKGVVVRLKGKARRDELIRRKEFKEYRAARKAAS